ncbi:MAG: hypothetical protein LBB94_01565 [Clostridiales bacterium]|jgi:hypothetical protein|nr:hypothetical protein [Clostridiales bacterium]
MERPHYRRVTGVKTPAGFKQAREPERSALSERLVTQFIVCGVIMALILVINLIDASVTHNISEGVKNVIQDQPTAADVKQVLTNASDTARTIFGNTYNDQTADNFDMASGAGTYNEESPGVAARTVREPVDFRIDEDILTQIKTESGEW